MTKALFFRKRITATAKKKTLLKLPDAEFIRRFAMHVLPKGFVRIRHYGILSSYHKKATIPKLQESLGKVDLPEREALQHKICPHCKKGTRVMIGTFTARGPPAHWLEKLKNQKKNLVKNGP